MLWKRVATSVLLVPVVWASAWFPQTPVPWFTIVIAVWALGALYEFYRIADATGRCCPLTFPGLALALIIIIQPLFDASKVDWLSVTLAVAVPLVWVMLKKDKSTAFVSWAWTLSGIMYLGWLGSHYIILRQMDYGREWVIFALFSTFVSGKVFGRHKMAPSISPGKTWEGAVGGLVGTVATSFILQWWLGLPAGYLWLALLAAGVSVFGQAGDLAESMFKRNSGAKESSHALPGHGGFLDRFDSVVFAGIIVYYVALFARF